jgi:ankyrin repeat protein
LDVGDNLSLNYALTNHESREPFVVSYTKTMLPAFINMTYTNKKDFAALRWAMKKGVHLPGLKLVIEEEFGEDDDYEDYFTDRVLWWLLCHGKSDIATVYAMSNELSVATRGYSSEYVNDCLRWAAGLGLKAVVEKLLGHEDADINKADDDDDDGRTPLFFASEEGRLEVVQALLHMEGIDINKADVYGWTPFYIASEKGHLEVVQALLGKDGIDINKADNDGMSPLYAASCYGHLEVVQALLGKEGIDINKADIGGWTPLHVASYNGHLEMVQALLGMEGIDINKADEHGRTPLHIAKHLRHSDIVSALEAAAPSQP